VLRPDGTKELARILDAFGITIGASTRTVQQRLKASGNGRQRQVVVAAQKYRRWLQEQGVEPPDLGSEPPPEPPFSEGLENHSGTTDQKPDNHRQEPPPEPPGTTTPGIPGTTGGVLYGTPLGPKPAIDDPEPPIDDLELARLEHLARGES
jgi:hypothetical protein